MNRWSHTSKNKLITCYPDLQLLANAVLQYIDCTVVCGKRNKIEQNIAHSSGLSKTPWPYSKHNVADAKGHEIEGLSLAIDLAPYVKGKGIVWDTKSCAYFAGVVMHLAHILKIPIRWGGDWDMDQDLTDQKFNDLIHFELIRRV